MLTNFNNNKLFINFFLFHHSTLLSSLAVDAHQIFFGGLVVGKAPSKIAWFIVQLATFPAVKECRKSVRFDKVTATSFVIRFL